MATQPISNLVTTWNAAGTTFTAIKMNVTDTASNAASALMELQTSGSSRFSLRKSGVGLASSEWQAPSIWATSVLYVGPSAQVGLISNGVGILEQRGGTNAQAFRLYNTYTDASNYERLNMYWSGNTAFLEQASAGTGTARNLWIGTTGATAVQIYTTNTGRWQVSSAGHFLAAADNTYDIGAAGANRPRRVFASDYVNAAGNVTAGGNAANIGTSGIQAASSVTIGFSSTTSADGAQDVTLARDAANTLAQRRGTSAQTFRVYNTYTDASNYERASIGWSASTFKIATEALGTGNPRQITLATSSSVAPIQFITNNTDRWNIAGAGHFLANTDNTYDIGASGANRPRNIYAGTDINAGGQVFGSTAVYTAANSVFYFNTRSKLKSPSDGVFGLYNNAESDFNRLQFGGTSSAFPSLKRSGAEMHVRLADDSAFAKLISAELSSTASLKAHVNTAIPAGGTAGAGVVVSSTSNFGMFFGSGAPTLSAAKGSLYLRSDGTTTNDRMYVNTDGATTWTAVTTAA